MADNIGAANNKARRAKWVILAGLTLLSAGLHYVVTDQVGRSLPEGGDGAESSIKRMEAAYVKEVKLSAPPVAVAKPAAAPGTKASKAKRKAKIPQDKASEPIDESKAAQQAEAKASEPEVIDKKPDTKVADAPPPPASAASTPPKGPEFVWPKATKVSFKVDGYFRGKMTGSSAVEWLRQGSKYQVHLDTTVGAIFTAQVTSEGEITPDGLKPLRFETKGRRFFSEVPLKTIAFEPDEIAFPDGTKVAKPEGVQDLVSHIIQLAYRFTLDPTLLKAGNSIQLKIATPKQLEDVAFDVISEEVLVTPMGPLNTFHVKPRRLIETGSPLPPMEIWFAPNLQYLPVRAYVERKDGPREKQFSVTMEMERAPQQVEADDK